jgi:type I restriction enzyme S subunit
MYGAAGQQRVPEEFVSDYVVGVPSHTEQLRLVELLDRRTAHINQVCAAKNRMLDLLREKRQALLLQAVTGSARLEPTTKSQAVAGTWEDTLPAGWRPMKLQWLLESSPKNGISPPPADGPGVPSFSIAAVRDGRVNIFDHLKEVELDHETARLYQVRTGDILVMRGNANQELVGTCGRVSEHPSECVYPDILIRVVPNHLVLPEFFVVALNSSVGRRQIEMLARTANGTLKISGEDLCSIRLPIPPVDEQRTIVEALTHQLEEVDGLAGLIEKQLAKLREYRQALITAAVTGKLDTKLKTAV